MLVDLPPNYFSFLFPFSLLLFFWFIAGVRSTFEGSTARPVCFYV